MLSSNRKAFLDTLAFAEGTSRIGDKDGYNVLVGGATFEGYDDHPRQRVFLKKLNVWSTAAGRYQLLSKYFDYYKKLLGLPDFSPDSQDLIALRQIKEQGAEFDVIDGRFDVAIAKCRNIWASLPGAGYGQHEYSLSTLRNKFVEFGGVLCSS